MATNTSSQGGSAMATISLKCACGKRRSRYAERCNTCHEARMAGFRAAAQVHVDRGTCPDCGTGLVRNLAMAGWYQCGAYADVAFRQPAYRNLPSCTFQCFVA